MEILTKQADNCTIVEVKGRLDTTNYNNLETELNKIIEKGKHNILVDCTNLVYVSSSGLRVFLVALKTLNKLKGKFLMSNLQDNIKEIFEISGFISIFKVFPSNEEALANC